MKQVVPRAPLPPRELPGTLEKTRNTEKGAPGKANQSALGPPLPALARGHGPWAQWVPVSELHAEAGG